MTNSTDLNLSHIEMRVSHSLKAWHLPDSYADDDLSGLLIVQTGEEANASFNAAITRRTAANRVLLASITELENQDVQLGQVLRLRFVERKKLIAVAYALSISEQTVSRLQKKGIQLLARIIFQRELAARRQHAVEVAAALPPSTYTRLFGVEQTHQKLVDLIIDRAGPAVLALIGIGGIGKTAVTDAVVRHIIRLHHFSRVIWLRIEHQTLSGRSDNPDLTIDHVLTELAAQLWPEQTDMLPTEKRIAMLQKAFGRFPHLVIIDNIESQKNADRVLDLLNQFSHPTRFLLTTRVRLSAASSVYNFHLTELPLPEAAALMRHYAQECGNEAVDRATDQDIALIYQVTGGNPLALKLVVSLLAVFSLPEVMAELTSAHSKSVAGMYRHIYQKSWMTLSDNGRKLLQAMPLLSDKGGTVSYLKTVSGLPGEKIRSALQELHSRSLIEVRGTIHEKRYGIHRLTYAFLCNDILNLPG